MKVTARIGIVTMGVALLAATGVKGQLTVTDGLQVWLKADVGVTTNVDGTVVSWADQSGNGYVATNSTPAFRPLLVSHALNNMPVVRFDGTSQYLQLGDILDNVLAGADKKFTFYLVARTTSIGTQVIFGKCADSSVSENQRQFYLLQLNRKLDFAWMTRMDDRHRFVDSSQTLATSQFYVLGCRYDGSVDGNDGLDRVDLRISGQAQTESMFSSVGALNDMEDGTAPLALGAVVSTAGTVAKAFFQGDMAEVLVYSNALSLADRASVESYLGAKYGIAVDGSSSIAIGQTKQFLADDMVIDTNTTSNVQRQMNTLTRYAGNPLLSPEKPWEGSFLMPTYSRVLRSADGLYRLWYRGGSVSLATSTNGLNWDRPNLGLVSYGGSTSNNIMALSRSDEGELDSIYEDARESDPLRRYKAMSHKFPGGGICNVNEWFSTNGLSWSFYAGNPVIPGNGTTHYGAEDNYLFGWDADVGQYVGYFRPFWPNDAPLIKRQIGRTTSSNGVNWVTIAPVIVPDATDDAMRRQFYYMPVHKTEDRGGVYWGLLHVFQLNPLAAYTNATVYPADDTVHIQLAFSRDGINWQRMGGRQPFLPISTNGSWDCRMTFSAGPLEVGDELRFYYGGFSTKHAESPTGSLGLATMPKDRFVSMKAGATQGTFTTLPVAFAGTNLVLNCAAVSNGYIKVEIQNASGVPLAGFTASDSIALTNDSVREVARWTGGSDVRSLTNAPVRLKFMLQNAELYTFQFLSTQPPTVPTGLAVGAKTDRSVTLVWNASTDDVRVAGYRIYEGGSLVGSSTATNFVHGGLAADTEYSYQVSAYDEQDNESGRSDALLVRTLPLDTEAPSVPANLRVTAVTDSSVSLAWNSSTDNIAVAAYRVYERGALVGSVAVTNFKHSGLMPNTAYSYTVQAGDAAGNWSGTSSPPVSATTLQSLLTNGLVGYWPLDENGGTTANDASGKGYHGTLAGVNTPVWTAPGKVGASSLLFNIQNYGDPSRVDLPSGLDALATNAGFSISAWCKPNAAPGNNYCRTTVIAGQTPNNDTGGNVLGYFYNGANDYRFYVRFAYGAANNLGFTAMSQVNCPVGVWYHVAGVVDRAGGTVKIYTNGVLSATTTFTAGTAAYALWPTYHWKLGAWRGNRDDTNYGRQTLDEVRMYNRVLSDGEVMELAGITPPDTQAPTLSVLTPANLSYTTNSQVDVTGTAADASGVASVAVNGATASTANGFANWNRTVTGLAAGTNVVTVVAVDTPGNAATNVIRVIYAAGAFDGNADGLPDAWQIRYFGFGFKTNALAASDADADQDGMSNADEYRTGTDPNDGADRLAMSAIQCEPGANASTVEWRSVSGRVYLVQWRTNLLTGDWVPVNPEVAATSNSARWTDGEAGASTSKFYRVGALE